MNPAGTLVGTTVGLGAAVVVTADAVVAAGDAVPAAAVLAASEGSAAGVRVARFTTAITDATAMTNATIAKVVNRRRSHLPDGFGAGSTSATSAATGSSAGLGGEDCFSPATSSGRGASLDERLSAAS